jgi:hypothetical protein
VLSIVDANCVLTQSKMPVSEVSEGEQATTIPDSPGTLQRCENGIIITLAENAVKDEELCHGKARFVVDCEQGSRWWQQPMFGLH